MTETFEDAIHHIHRAFEIARWLTQNARPVSDERWSRAYRNSLQFDAEGSAYCRAIVGVRNIPHSPTDRKI